MEQRSNFLETIHKQRRAKKKMLNRSTDYSSATNRDKGDFKQFMSTIDREQLNASINFESFKQRSNYIFPGTSPFRMAPKPRRKP